LSEYVLAVDFVIVFVGCVACFLVHNGDQGIGQNFKGNQPEGY